MKKKYGITLIIILLILIVAFVNANPIDDFFSESNGNENNAKFEDTATANNYSKDWYNVAITEKRDSAGTTISNNYNSEATSYHFANKPNTPSNSFEDVMDWSSPFTVEFDVVNANNNSNFIQIYDGKHEIRETFGQLHIVDGSHVKIESSGSSVTFNVDNNKTTQVNESLTSDSRIGLCLMKDGSLKYKNFVIY